jgi:hypothetical protein
MPASFTDVDAEEAALGWRETLGYTVRTGRSRTIGWWLISSPSSRANNAVAPTS